MKTKPRLTAQSVAYAMRIMATVHPPLSRVEAQGLIAQAYAAGQRKRIRKKALN